MTYAERERAINLALFGQEERPPIIEKPRAEAPRPEPLSPRDQLLRRISYAEDAIMRAQAMSWRQSSSRDLEYYWAEIHSCREQLAKLEAA